MFLCIYFMSWHHLLDTIIKELYLFHQPIPVSIETCLVRSLFAATWGRALLWSKMSPSAVLMVLIRFHNTSPHLWSLGKKSIKRTPFRSHKTVATIFLCWRIWIMSLTALSISKGKSNQSKFHSQSQCDSRSILVIV